MHDTSSKIALIQSRLPYTDRGALSEAWFSALHLAANDPDALRVSQRRTAAFQSLPQPAARAAAQAPAHIGREHAQPAHASRASTHRGAGESERFRLRALRDSARVRADARCVRDYPPFRTSLKLGSERGRVHLLLRRDGSTLHVVALCRPQAADTVRRALALADAHLRSRGESVRASVRAVTTTAVGA